MDIPTTISINSFTWFGFIFFIFSLFYHIPNYFFFLLSYNFRFWLEKIINYLNILFFNYFFFLVIRLFNYNFILKVWLFKYEIIFLLVLIIDNIVYWFKWFNNFRFRLYFFFSTSSSTLEISSTKISESCVGTTGSDGTVFLI